MDVSNLKFMSNHNHNEISNFRNKDSIIRIPQLIDRAIELGYNGVSITDHEALTGHVKFLQHYDELRKSGSLPEGFKVCLGNEIYLMSQKEYEEAKINYESGVTKYWHFILLAKDKIGYQQLKQISSESAWKNYFRQGRQERVPTIKEELEDIIGDNKGHLIASTACIGGELAHLINEYFFLGKEQAKVELHKFITWMIRIFGKENVFLEMQPCKDVKVLINEEEQFHSQVIVNQSIVKLAKAYGLNYQVTTDSHYLKETDIKIHEAFLNSDEEGKNYRETSEFYKTCYMWDVDKLFENLKEHLQEDEVAKAFEGTQKIHEMVDVYSLYHEVIVPEDKHVPLKVQIKDVFKDYYDKYKYINNFAKSEFNQDRELLRLIENGFLDKKQEFNETNLSRIDKELGIVWEVSEKLQQKLSSYYVLVRNIIQDIMWKISYVGPARGSVTGFYTAYLSNITQVNPIPNNLPEWRHLHHQRPELPDIDVDSEASKRSLIFEKMKEYFGEDNVLNTLTLKTEGSKSTMLTCCRGMGIDNDVAQAMADMIPFERGANWSLTDCFNGNEEKERKPVTELINEVAKYEGLKEALFMTEGLISGRSIHASAVYIFSEGYLNQNSKMRAPNGTWITAYNMTDSDFCGSLKFDALTVSALDKLHQTVDLLIENGFIEDKGSIKSNYDAYIYPDILDYKSEKMWEMLGNNDLIDAFQFDTTQGLQAARKVKPKSLKELAIANSLMRLMSDGEEQPMDEYVKYKDDIQLWYDEMRIHNLNDKEIKILEKHLLQDYGVSAEQESVMEMTMDENISGFDVKEANGLRKAIAKKKPKLLEETKELFYKKGQELNTRKELLDYVWNVQFKRQFGLI